MTRAEIAKHVKTMRKLSKGDRADYLERLIGPPTTSPGLLDARARLVTELNVAGIWPVRSRISA